MLAVVWSARKLNGGADALRQQRPKKNTADGKTSKEANTPSHSQGFSYCHSQGLSQQRGRPLGVTIAKNNRSIDTDSLWL